MGETTATPSTGQLRRSLQSHLVSVAGLVGRPVFGRDGARIGRMCDVVVLAGEPHPPVTGFIVQIGDRRAWLHGTDLAGLDQARILLTTSTVNLQDVTRRPAEVQLVTDVVDHQLVDVRGVRVVRASDLYLANPDGVWRLVGVDVSWSSFLRRALPGGRGRRPSPKQIIDWADIHSLAVSEEGTVQVEPPSEQLRVLSAADLADLLGDLGHSEGREFLADLSLDDAADALELLPSDHAARLLGEESPERAAALLASMATDEAVEALRDLSTQDRRSVLAAMDAESRAEMTTLLTYDEDSAAGMMTAGLVKLPTTTTVARAIEELRAAQEEPERIGFVVLVDDQGRLVDDVSAAELLMAAPDDVVTTLIRPPFPTTVDADARVDEVVDAMRDNRGAPVIVLDEDRHPIGWIQPDDVIDAVTRDSERRWPWQSTNGEAS